MRHYSTSILPSWLTTLSGFREAAAILGEDSEDRITPYGFVAYDQIDSGLNADGPHLAALVGLDRVQNWTGLTSVAKHARKQRWMDRIVADLDQQGLLESVKPYLLKLPVGDRTGTIIEPMLTDQWFVRMETLAKLGDKFPHQADVAKLMQTL